MTDQEAQALAVINDIDARLKRIETRLCKLMLYMNVDPSPNDGYVKPEPKPINYWENKQ